MTKVLYILDLILCSKKGNFMNLKILNFIIVLILLSSITFGYETVFDWTLTWDEKDRFSSGIGENVGSSVTHDLKNPFIFDWLSIDISNSPSQCGNSLKVILQDQNHNEIKSAGFGSSGTLFIGNQTGSFIVVEKTGGNQNFEVNAGCGNFVNNYYNCIGQSLGLSKPKKKKVSCSFNYYIGAKFMDPINSSNTISITNDCSKGATGSGNDDCPKDIGRVGDLISPPKTTAVKILSTNNQVLAWLDPVGSLSYDSSTSSLITSDFDYHVYACVDSDKNNKCDFDQIGECFNLGGDWYKDNCCMPPSINLPQGSKLTKNVPGYYPSIGICGKNSKGDYKWAPLEAGVFSELDQEPGIRVVSDGQRYLDCGGKTASLAPNIASLVSPLNLLTVKRTIIATPKQITQPRTYDKAHSFSCNNNKIYECKGDDTAYLSKSSIILEQSKIGNKLLDPQGKTLYCTDDGFFDSDIDKPNRAKACNNAGFKHTGTKCCGEPEDKPEYYNDLNNMGTCWDSRAVLNGEFASGIRSIISHDGSFNGCNVQDPNLLALKDSHNQQKLITELTSGTFLLNVNKTNSATCQPYGNFTLTKSQIIPSKISAAWDVTKEGFAQIHQEGYCDNNVECWNGVDCQATKTFYLLKDKSQGFVCV